MKSQNKYWTIFEGARKASVTPEVLYYKVCTFMGMCVCVSSKTKK